jgi:hypothetical protein
MNFFCIFKKNEKNRSNHTVRQGHLRDIMIDILLLAGGEAFVGTLTEPL